VDFKLAIEHEILDLRGLKCPLPALMARRALARRFPGTVLVVVADDPLAVLDIPYMCSGEGHTVMETYREGDLAHFVLVRGQDRGQDENGDAR
jgi:tRNA 2-thiouridine synthesizing protein A